MEILSCTPKVVAKYAKGVYTINIGCLGQSNEKHRRTNKMARAKVSDTRDWLKDLRKEKGLTVRKIAPLLGISFSHYNDIENGRRNPSLKLAVKMSDFLEFDVKKLA